MGGVAAIAVPPENRRRIGRGAAIRIGRAPGPNAMGTLMWLTGLPPRMSDAENGGIVDTVTQTYRSRADNEMNLVGLLYGVGLILVLIPLLPFIALIWLASWLFAGGADVERGYE